MKKRKQTRRRRDAAQRRGKLGISTVIVVLIAVFLLRGHTMDQRTDTVLRELANRHATNRNAMNGTKTDNACTPAVNISAGLLKIADPFFRPTSPNPILFRFLFPSNACPPPEEIRASVFIPAFSFHTRSCDMDVPKNFG